MASARGLNHDASPEVFADAMVACQGYAPECSQAGVCQHSGDCFRKSPALDAAKAIRRLAENYRERAPSVAAELWQAVEYLRDKSAAQRDAERVETSDLPEGAR